jgi:hypothetical protein
MRTISVSAITFDEYLTRYEGEGPNSWFADLDMAKLRAEYHETVAVLCVQFGELTQTADGELIAPPCVWAYASRKVTGADPVLGSA